MDPLSLFYYLFLQSGFSYSFFSLALAFSSITWGSRSDAETSQTLSRFFARPTHSEYACQPQNGTCWLGLKKAYFDWCNQYLPHYSGYCFVYTAHFACFLSSSQDYWAVCHILSPDLSEHTCSDRARRQPSRHALDRRDLYNRPSISFFLSVSIPFQSTSPPVETVNRKFATRLQQPLQRYIHSIM